MGMFDYIRCKYPVEGWPEGTVLEGQTKDFDCEMITNEIAEDGSLWVDNGYHEEVPKEERPYPDAPEGTLYALAGCIRRVPKMEKLENFTGSVHFYGDKDGRRFYYTAVWLKGKLMGIAGKADPASGF